MAGPKREARLRDEVPAVHVLLCPIEDVHARGQARA
ncbi:hypothetical protein RPYSC3_04570 [Rhodopseudomonas palustris]|nr:hypothetical protein RPYSC3_04570 [Rhodopseudomonas palustris]